MSEVVLFGASELGRDVASMAPALRDGEGGRTLRGFVDDRSVLHGTTLLDLPVLGGGEWLQRPEARGLEVVVTIGDPAVRRRIAERLAERGVRFATIVHPSVVLTRWVRLGEGTVVMAGCTFTAGIRIGRHVMLNPGCTVAHDVIVGDYAYLSPGVHLAGRAVLGDDCHLGTGAVVIPGRTVGARTVVGAGAVVAQDVPPDVTAVGVPARALERSRSR